MATATRPGSAGVFEIESADDFVLTHSTSITDATFTGLIPSGASPTKVIVEIYRVFPALSDVGRTSGPPTFSTPNVPTRVNSPSDIALDERDVSMTSSTKVLNPSFTAGNSVQPGGIHLPTVPPGPPGGDGPVMGEEVGFDVVLLGHSFCGRPLTLFVPQVQLDSGDFLWLSAARPIGASGIPFPSGFTDLQSWTRDASEAGHVGIEPDWLRVGTDIVGGTPAPTFNAAFSLSAVPEPSTWAMMLLGFAGLGYAVYRRAREPRVTAA